VSGPDAGMYDAINAGLARSSGQILAYLNSDDAYLPWAVETVVRAFERRPEVDLLFGDGVKVKTDTGSQRLRLFGPFDLVSLASYESLLQPAVFWRRRLYEQIGGFDPALRYVGDLDYWLRAATAGAVIGHVSEVLAVERIHPGRLSSAQRDRMAEEDRIMRARHAGPVGGAAARSQAVDRDERWQRWLWMRFMAAAGLRPLPTSWPRFLGRGRVTLRPARVLEGSEPHAHHHEKLWGAMTSALAAEVLGLPSKPGPKRSPGRAIGARLRLIGLALSDLLPSRLALRSVRPRRDRST
jgi:hypothetical protein